MLTRRRFLGFVGSGLLAASAGCRPLDRNLLSERDAGAAANIDAHAFLAAKAENLPHKNLLLGYPVNMNTPPEDFFAWRKQLAEVGIDVFAFNNVGNPYKKSAIPFNTHDFEREVIGNFGKLFGFAPNDLWGFLSNSGTDSNMHGMYMGRTLLHGRTGVMPKAYFTPEAHYSVQILRDLLGLETVFVATKPDGSMDAGDLRRKVAENSAYPALVVATIGTTFKGAVDPVDRIQEALQGHPSYLHLDAALFGGYLPYTAHASDVQQRSKLAPNQARYDSIAVSCHKFFGFPSPAGLFITTASRFNAFNALFSRIHNPEYIHHVPGTITCSRDAVKPAEFYFFSTPEAMARQAEDARAMLQNAGYLMEEMQTHFAHLDPTRAGERSNTVYFKKPADWIVEKYSLATMHLEKNAEKQEYAHVVVMPHADRQVLSEFLADLQQDAQRMPHAL
ncbi:MAG: pyridoxal-dependent decarboxylase [Gammaproteobacteria bacterium]